MSCWVVPSIAAELWGVSIDHVHAGMKSGEIPHKQEAGFTFVDVAPHSPKLETPKCVHPPTYTAVSPEEMVALHPDDDHTLDLGDWRTSRDDAEKRRIGPIAA